MLSRLLEYLPFALPLYLIRFHIGPLPTTLLEVYLLLIFLIYLYERGVRAVSAAWSALGAFRLPVLAWFVTTGLAVVVSPNIWTGLGLWRAYVLEPILIFCILLSVSRDNESRISLDREQFTRHLFLTVIIFTCIAIAQFVTGDGIPHPWNVSIAAGRRATGPFSYPNALALFVVPVGAYAFAKWINQGRKLFSWESLGFVAACVSTVLARSDGGVIALGAAVWIVLVLHKCWRKWLIVLTLAATLLVALLPALSRPIVHELTFQGWSGKVRMYMWRDTVAMLKDHWFFGAGFGGYPTVFKRYQRTRGIEIFQYPHNIVLNLWSETGLLGLLAFTSIVIIYVIEFLRQKRSLVYLAPLAALLIHGLVDAPYFKNDLALLFWILLWLTLFIPSSPPSHLSSSVPNTSV